MPSRPRPDGEPHDAPRFAPRQRLTCADLPVLMRATTVIEAFAIPAGGDRRAALDTFLRQQVKRQRAIGVTAQVVRRDGEIVYAGTAGRRDLNGNEPIQPDTTLFRLASMTKPITAVAVLMLVEAGRIGLDDPIGVITHPLTGTCFRC